MTNLRTSRKDMSGEEDISEAIAFVSGTSTAGKT
jgi:hypothetical protein